MNQINIPNPPFLLLLNLVKACSGHEFFLFSITLKYHKSCLTIQIQVPVSFFTLSHPAEVSVNRTFCSLRLWPLKLGDFN